MFSTLQVLLFIPVFVCITVDGRCYDSFDMIDSPLIPTHYDIKFLELQPSGKSTLMFQMLTTISMYVQKVPKGSIKLNLYSFSPFHRIEMTLKSNKTQLLTENKEEIMCDTRVIQLNGTKLKVGQTVRLSFWYQFVVRPFEPVFVHDTFNDNTGAYWWRASDNNTYISTHLQPFGASLVFPSINRPDYKATFQLHFNKSITSSKWLNGSTVLSNTRLDTNASEDSSFLTFETTPIMSTYLVAFAIGKFNKIGEISNGTEVNIWYPIGLKDISEAEEYLSTAIETLGFMTNYTRFSYPMKKLDVVFVQMWHKGMENFGLITHSYTDKPQTAKWVAIHEVVHQWFGNLVTMANWNDIWLNEGFANFFQHKLQWNYHDLISDSLAKCSKDEELVADFKFTKSWKCKYRSGGSLLVMIESVMGKTRFRAAVRRYIKKFAFKNAKSADLIEMLQKAAHNYNITGWNNDTLNMSSFINPWLNNIGYPIVKVKKFTTEFELSQESTANATDQWYIPMRVQRKNFGSKLYWLQPRQTLTISKNMGNSWEFDWNANMTGFYRVRYAN